VDSASDSDAPSTADASEALSDAESDVESALALEADVDPRWDISVLFEADS
jgi:hypothetical protein